MKTIVGVLPVIFLPVIFLVVPGISGAAEEAHVVRPSPGTTHFGG